MSHIRDGKFYSDRHNTPADIVGLDATDPRFQDLIWEYAERWREEDPAFTDELQAHLRTLGFAPTTTRKGKK